MTYTILQRREETYPAEIFISETESIMQDQNIVFTLVEYDFDGTKITVDIPHFMPPDEDYIILGIENCGITQQQKLGLIE
jgi:hypothetical protein